MVGNMMIFAVMASVGVIDYENDKPRFSLELQNLLSLQKWKMQYMVRPFRIL